MAYLFFATNRKTRSNAKRIISGAKKIINFWDKSFKNDNGVVYVVQR